jgi:hypothetical protein
LTDYGVSLEIYTSFYQLLNLVWLCRKETHAYIFIQICLGFLFFLIFEKERVLKEGPWYEGGDANSMWTRMTTCIKKVASEEFGVTKGGKREVKETWW